MKLIEKSVVIAEIEKRIQELRPTNTHKMQVGERINRDVLMWLNALTWVKDLINSLETKEVESKNDTPLIWKDIRELYIIFAEVDTEIEFRKCDIQEETIGYYQEVLKRFKALKEESKHQYETNHPNFDKAQGTPTTK